MKVAVIGSGISGLSAAWILSQSQQYDVSLFEAQDYFGGHSNTVDVFHEGLSHPVDTGFLVHNPNTYPNLLALFENLNVKTIETDMSFSVKLVNQDVEWAGTNLLSVFAQKKNLFRPRFWRMILDIMRFNKSAVVFLEKAKKENLTLGQLLKIENFSEEMKNWYLIPMGAAIWSSSTAEILEFPAANFIQFCLNHSLLQVEGRPKWRTVAGGSRVYVKKMIDQIAKAYLNEPVLSVERNQLLRVTTSKRSEVFDRVIFACHSDQVLRIFKGINSAEHSIISKIRYQKNQAYLHCDEALLPRAKKVWSAWNYSSISDDSNFNAVSVTYLINKLQPLPFVDPIMVTLNPQVRPDEKKTFKVIEYDHPVFDQSAIEAQQKLTEIQDKDRVIFAGAWCGYGFHEDGLKAGIAAAHLLGAQVPWQS